MTLAHAVREKHESGIEKCRMIDFPRVAERRGNLSFIESGKHVPFEIKRVFYVYDIPTGEKRGAHAHRDLEEVVLCLSGGLDVVLNDGRETKVVHLNRPNRGLYIPRLIWTNMENFYPNTVYVVLASTPYNEKDYIRDYDHFLEIAGGNHQ